jgi:hypothetical protein
LRLRELGFPEFPVPNGKVVLGTVSGYTFPPPLTYKVATMTYDELVAENDRLRAAAKTSVETKINTIQHNRDLMHALSVVMTCLSELDAKHLTAMKDGVRRVETDRATRKAIRRA